MTSSETQTSNSDGLSSSSGRRWYTSAAGWTSLLSRHSSDAIGVGLLLVGLVVILDLSRWHFTVPAVMLWLGWGSVLVTVRLLVRAGAALSDDVHPAEAGGFDLSASHREDLDREKKLLLKAIKEIEFDRDLGKMSDSDFDEIVRVYRLRAIDIIKELDGGGKVASISEQIDRDVAALLAVQSARKSGARSSSKKSGDQRAQAAPLPVASKPPGRAFEPGRRHGAMSEEFSTTGRRKEVSFGRHMVEDADDEAAGELKSGLDEPTET